MFSGTVTFKTDVNIDHTKTDNELARWKTEHNPKVYEEEKNDFDTSTTGCNERIPYGQHQSQEFHLKCTVMERNLNKIDNNEKIINNAKAVKNTAERDIPSNEQDVTADYHSDYPLKKSTEPLLKRKETATLNYSRQEYIGVEVSKQSSDIKESTVQRSDMVDKNTFIQVFLNRAASARSKQNSSISFENINSSYAESYIDNRDEVYQNEDSRGLAEDNYSKGCDAREDSPVIETVTAPDIQESVQYSIQNEISASLQTTNSVEDADSLKSVEQGKQKLLTQQRYMSFISNYTQTSWVSLNF